MKKKTIVLILILTLMAMLMACEKNPEEYYASGKEKHMKLTDDMDWYNYDSDNLLGITATVYDERCVTYVFDKEVCLFNGEDVKNALDAGELYGCKASGLYLSEPEAVIYEKKDDKVQLTLFYDDEELEKVDGFWFYFSGDEYIRCGYTKSTMYITHEVITERGTKVFDNEECEWRSGDEWSQNWNLKNSGKWNSARKKHFYEDDSPVE